MLSRVAHRLYWLARYMERAENTARIINVNSNLLFDLPRGTRISWKTLIEIIGAENQYSSRYSNYEERSIMRFLIVDELNPSSIINCLAMARENARTTKEILPSEAWEKINELYLIAKEDLDSGLARKNRYDALQKVIYGCQLLVGLLSGTMSNNAAYDVMRIGRNLERADMGTRIIDIGSANFFPHLIHNKEESIAVEFFQSILWMNILVSLSAYQMYRQHVRNRVDGIEVVRYLLKDDDFPRATIHCLSQIQECVEKLPEGLNIANGIEKIKKKILTADIGKLIERGLKEYIDSLQVDFNGLNEKIENKWLIT